MHIIAPDIDTMPPNQDSIRVREVVHSFLKTVSQVLLVRRVLDNRNPQPVKVAKVALLASSLRNTLDLLDLLDLETCGGAEVALHEQRY